IGAHHVELALGIAGNRALREVGDIAGGNLAAEGADLLGAEEVDEADAGLGHHRAHRAEERPAEEAAAGNPRVGYRSLCHNSLLRRVRSSRFRVRSWGLSTSN